jgi:SAM-dependent methyltransferase
MRQAGFDASGVELSPWVVEFGRKTFDVPISLGPAHNLDLESGGFDVVVLMDVLEHLPDPVGTMSHALGLLKADGILLIQTPEFKDEMKFEELSASQGAFLKMLQPNEHIYLFTKSSVRSLFDRLGADNLVFEPAVFYQYDMFFLVCKQLITPLADETRQGALEARSTGRFVQAMLDLDSHIKVVETDRADRLDQIHTLTAQIAIIEADRADRLDQINTLTRLIHELQPPEQGRKK